MRYEDFELADGQYTFERTSRLPRRTLRVWTEDGEQWACVASDHTDVFCRRDKKLDPIAAACLSLALEGAIEVWDDPEQGMLFRNTAAGNARVETAIRRGGFGHGMDA